MKALVVYESMFGNTRTVAEAIADGLRVAYDVTLSEVGAAPAAVPDDVALLVAGGPTHAFGLSRESTRADARKQAGGTVVSGGIGLREWLDALPRGSADAATFDTRVSHPRVPGSAAKKAAKRLRHSGFRVAEAETFWVSRTPGPLDPGEVERARAWGAGLATTLGDQPERATALRS